jgi:hypothetical protein
VLGIAPLQTKVITQVVTLYGSGQHKLWAQADTSDLVYETNRHNNIIGPIVVEASGDEPPLIPPEEEPPGLRECVQAIELGSFEASIITPPWSRNAFAHHTTLEKHAGNFSLELQAKEPGKNAWTYQAVDVPADILTDTLGTLSYWQLVEPDPPESAPDPDDRFHLTVRNSSGVAQTENILLAQGDSATPVFQQKVINVETYLPGDGIMAFAGSTIQLRFEAVHDDDATGTSFYIDDVRFDICTTRPIPPNEPGTASIGGLVEVWFGDTPAWLPGISVWLFAGGGELYRTTTIHDGTYHFYNVPPGTYTVYAEVWVGGILYTGIIEVRVVADQRDYDVDLLLR